MRFFSRVFLPFLLLGYIATETYFKLQNSSLCGDVGCKLAGELLKFDALYLNYFGLAGLFFLVLLGYISLKNKFFEGLFFIGLYSAIAFETTLISYQFIANPEPCIFCLGILGSLLVIALFAHIKSFVVVLASMAAIFLALNTLAVSKNKTFAAQTGNYLIQSDTCAHCKKVKTYFSEHNIAYTPISTKEANARSFLKFVNITSIPVLIIKEESDTTLITGDKKIIKYFESIQNSGTVTPPTLEAPIENSTMELSADFLSAGGHDDGCAITITETPSCEDDNATQTPPY